jgi:hypothetical protein
VGLQLLNYSNRGFKSAEVMDVRLLCLLCCVGSGLCDGLIAGPEESCRVCVCACLCLIVCDLETSKKKVALARFGLAETFRHSSYLSKRIIAEPSDLD